MSILTKPPESFIEISGERYEIRTDFRVWIRVSEIFEKKSPSGEEIAELLKTVYVKIPKNLCDALWGISEFLAKGKKGKGKRKKKSEKFFDFEYDAEYIYSAFFQQYGIDLSETELHWHKFKALLSGLSEDTAFMKIASYRQLELSSVTDKKMKKRIKEMKAEVALPSSKDENEREAEQNERLSVLF